VILNIGQQQRKMGCAQDKSAPNPQAQSNGQKPKNIVTAKNPDSNIKHPKTTLHYFNVYGRGE
jgi:hypothetical protein